MKQITDVFGRRLEKKGVTRIQWIGLYYLGKHGQLSQKELSGYMHIKESTIVRLVDRMERDGFVLRQKSPSDRRTTMLSLTDKGHQYRHELLPEGEIFNDWVTADISSEELETFTSVLSRMLENSRRIE